jgi:tetratricopeptide (TPR) repeat protein
MKHCIFICVFAAAAYAQPAGGNVSALEASGNKHFELAEYDAAIADFKEAYRIGDAPGYLYNIAQAYRLKGDCRNAAIFYKNYLRRQPDASNAAKVRERITEMEACAAKQPPEPVVTPPTTTTTDTTTPTTTTTSTANTAQPEASDPAVEEPEQPPVANNRGWMKIVGFSAIGAGAVSFGLGVKFMLDGKSANDDLKTKCMVSCTSADALAIQDDGKKANTRAVIAGVAGGALVVTGVVLVVLGHGSGGQPEVAITPTGASASYAWSF